MRKMAEDLIWALDAVEWARRLYPLDPWQEDVLRASSGRVLLCCARQAGKSTVAALLALHTALYHPGSLILLLSPSLRQSSELFRRVAALYQQVESPPPVDAESSLRL